MALDFAEVQRVLEEAAKADNNRKEIRKGLGKVHSLIQALDIALGDVISLVDADALAPKERKTYTGKPRGRKPKNAVDNTGDIFATPTPDTTPDESTPVGKKAYMISVDGQYRLHSKKYTGDKNDTGIKIFQGDPEKMKQKLIKEEGIAEESFKAVFV